MPRYEIKVETEKKEPVYEGEHTFRDYEKAEAFAQKIATVAEPREGDCKWELKLKK